jgi:uncharacterized integral membrane protein
MNNVWLKIKIWTKGICAALVLLYLLIFVIENNQEVTFWWWRHREIKSSSLLLLIIAFLVGVISTILLRTTLRTMKQIREVRNRSRTDRMERDLNDMKLKASRLQTKPAAGATATSAEPKTNLPPDESAD